MLWSEEREPSSSPAAQSDTPCAMPSTAGNIALFFIYFQIIKPIEAVTKFAENEIRTALNVLTFSRYLISKISAKNTTISIIIK